MQEAACLFLGRIPGHLGGVAVTSAVRSQGWQEQNHTVTGVEPLLLQPEALCTFSLQVPASSEVLLVVLPDSPR